MQRPTRSKGRPRPSAPRSTNAATARAERLINAGKPEEAIRLLKPILARDPSPLAAHQLLVHAYMAQGDGPRASIALMNWLDADPSCPEIYQLLGQLAIRNGDLLLARNWALTGLEVVPGDFDLLVMAAQCGHLLGEGVEGLLERARAADAPRFARIMRDHWVDGPGVASRQRGPRAPRGRP